MKKNAFSLVELLVAMAIIALLISIAAFGINIVQRNSRNTERKKELDNIRLAIIEAELNSGAKITSFDAEDIASINNKIANVAGLGLDIVTPTVESDSVLLTQKPLPIVTPGVTILKPTPTQNFSQPTPTPTPKLTYAVPSPTPTSVSGATPVITPTITPISSTTNSPTPINNTNTTVIGFGGSGGSYLVQNFASVSIDSSCISEAETDRDRLSICLDATNRQIASKLEGTNILYYLYLGN